MQHKIELTNVEIYHLINAIQWAKINKKHPNFWWNNNVKTAYKMYSLYSFEYYMNEILGNNK